MTGWLPRDSSSAGVAPVDRRNVRITLTADGRELVPRLAHIVYANNDHFASRLDSTEQAEFVRMFEKDPGPRRNWRGPNMSKQ